MHTHLPVADSKLLYKPNGGLALLELSVLALLATVEDDIPCCWRDIWALLDPEAANQLCGIPWYASYDERLPVACDPNDVLHRRDRLRTLFQTTQARLTGLASRVVFAEHFNRLVHDCQNKSTGLSHVTITLARDVTCDLERGSIHVHCDKHGGRNHYAALLQHVFQDHFVEVLDEGREVSVYRMGPTERRYEIRFSARGEQSLPTALASMVSKYLRELAMRAFNHFWQGHQDDLRPTAGYPTDAKRFLADIGPTRQRLNIADHILWRSR